MPIDFTLFTLDKAIVHDVPRHKKGVEGHPDFSEVESPLDQEVILYLEGRIRDTLHSHGQPIEFIEEHESCVQREVATIFDTKGAFVEASKRLAQYLYDCQGGTNSGGLLMVVLGRMKRVPCVAVVKLERENGTRIAKSGAGLDQTFVLSYMRDLMLTQKTRVFKAALFVRDGKTITGHASDPQTLETPLAHFFLNTFLGCTLTINPKVSTLSYFEATHSFINDRIESPQEKADAYLGLMAQMKSASTRVSPGEFAESHLPRRLRPAYMNYLLEASAPTTRFQKDTALVQNRLLKLKISFKHGAAVLATEESIEANTVRIEDSRSDGKLKVVIEDEVVDLKGRKN